MDYYAGIDVSLKDSSVCVVDANGKIVGSVAIRATIPVRLCLVWV
jgi:transposase